MLLTLWVLIPSQNTVHVTCMLHVITVDLHELHDMHVVMTDMDVNITVTYIT